MLDLAIVLVLVVLNALAHSAYVRWRRTPKSRRIPLSARRSIAYPTHPSPGFTSVPDNAVWIRPAGMDW